MSRVVESKPRYIGRFAPSPTGPLHFGSLVTALASFLCARAAHGEWLLRIDDIDPPRHVVGADAAIMQTLTRCGLHWDRNVYYQSARRAVHREVCDALLARNLAYYCVCSRRELSGETYPGTCRERHTRPAQRHCIRVRVDHRVISINDSLRDSSTCNLAADGDFVIWRVEDLPAYHLAAVLDDAEAGVTEIVRGADLLDSAPRQRYLQLVLGLPSPVYLHLPIAVSPDGRKLSKQNRASAIADLPVNRVLQAALAWLGHATPTALHAAAPGILLDWAVEHWELARIPRLATLAAPTGPL